MMERWRPCGPEDQFALPLTVWVGSIRYVFAPGRDVIVGYGQRVDIPLDGPATPLATAAPRSRSCAAVQRYPVGGHRQEPRRHLRRWLPDVDGRHPRRSGDHDRRSAAGPAADLPGRRSRPPGSPPLPTAPRPPGATPRRASTRHRPPPPAPPRPPPVPPPPRPASRAAGADRAGHPANPGTPPPKVPPAAPPPTVPPPAPPSAPSDPRMEQPKDLRSDRTDDHPTDPRRGAVRARAQPAGNPTYRLPLKPGARTSGVAAYRLGLTSTGRSCSTASRSPRAPGTLTAVIGPSAARNSALLGLLAGTREPSSGTVTVDGHDVHAEPESMRSRIGIVGRDDRMHPQPHRRTGGGIRRRTAAAAGHFGRAPRPRGGPGSRRTRIDPAPHDPDRQAWRPNCAGCASMAIELVTRPTLLVVDEPGAGLDADAGKPRDGGAAAPGRHRLCRRGGADTPDIADSPGPDATRCCCSPLPARWPSPGRRRGSSPRWARPTGRRSSPHVVADPDGAHRAFAARQPDLADMAQPEVAAPVGAARRAHRAAASPDGGPSPAAACSSPTASICSF